MSRPHAAREWGAQLPTARGPDGLMTPCWGSASHSTLVPPSLAGTGVKTPFLGQKLYSTAEGEKPKEGGKVQS